MQQFKSVHFQIQGQFWMGSAAMVWCLSNHSKFLRKFNTAQRFLSLSDEKSKCDCPTENSEFCPASTKVSNILPDTNVQGQHTAFVSGSCSEVCVCPSVFLVFSPSSCLLFSVCVYPLCVVCLAWAWLPPSRCWNPVAGTPD